jgi:hypothetical protein
MRIRLFLAIVLAVSLTAAACTNSSTEISTTTTTAEVAAQTVTTEAATETVAAEVETETTTVTSPEVGFLFVDVTDTALGESSGWSNKVELADLDGDGDVDILFADGGTDTTPGVETLNQAWINDGSGVFEDRSVDVFGETLGYTHVIRVRDVDDDGIVDVFVGAMFDTQSRLLLGVGGLQFEDVTTTHLPQRVANVSDAEFGDVDADGDLDLVIADRGPGSPKANDGARPMLWLNNGDGSFTDVSAEQMPDISIEYSWDLELVDVDNDHDLDIVVSCQTCAGSFLLRNDGSGMFDNASADLPQFSNNYDFETVDMDGDGFADLITLNDAPDRTRHEHLFLSDGLGGFVDATAELWPDGEQITAQNADDNAVVIVDFDSDGDPDLLIGHLGSHDRFLVNDGTGRLTILEDIFSGSVTGGTLGIALADLNGDNVLDAVQSQGFNASDNRVFLGDALLPDTAPPIIQGVSDVDGVLHARVHDNKTPVMPHDWQRVFAEGPDGETDLVWYGEALWRVTLATSGEYRVCAIDRAGNESCSALVDVTVP